MVGKEEEEEDSRRIGKAWWTADRGIERRECDKKTPAGVIMITAVQRKTEYCGARMAAMGSWEIGILERHFRVSVLPTS